MINIHWGKKGDEMFYVQNDSVIILKYKALQTSTIFCGTHSNDPPIGMTITMVFNFLLFPLMHLNWHNIMWEEFETLSKWNFTAGPTMNKLRELNDVNPFGFLTFGRTQSQKNLAWLHKTQGLSLVKIFSIWVFLWGTLIIPDPVHTGPLCYCRAQTHGARPNPRHCHITTVPPLVAIIKSIKHRNQLLIYNKSLSITIVLEGQKSGNGWVNRGGARGHKSDWLMKCPVIIL